MWAVSIPLAAAFAAAAYGLLRFFCRPFPGTRLVNFARLRPGMTPEQVSAILCDDDSWWGTGRAGADGLEGETLRTDELRIELQYRGDELVAGQARDAGTGAISRGELRARRASDVVLRLLGLEVGRVRRGSQ